jgi:hypothetical protein
VVDNDNMQEQAPSWDSAGADLNMGSEPGWSSPVQNSHHRLPRWTYHKISTEQDTLSIAVVNRWDPQKKISKVCRLRHFSLHNCLVVDTQASWHHLQRTTIGDTLVTVCQCPLSRPKEACVHQQFLLDYGEELFPSNTTFTNGRLDILKSI